MNKQKSADRNALYKSVLSQIVAHNTEAKEDRRKNSVFAFVLANGGGFDPAHLRRCPKKALGVLADRLGSQEEAAKQVLDGTYLLSEFHLYVDKSS